MPTKNELKLLQALPLELKVMKTKQRIKEWVDYYGVDGVYVSFSGGKDSTVLLSLVRELYPEIEAVFINTGLEYPEIQNFVKSFDNVSILRPEMRFDEVIKKYGYPIISKEVSQNVYEVLKYGPNRAIRTYSKFFPESEYCKKYPQFCLEKWLPLLKLDFKISHLCCNIMKKSPAKDFEKFNDKKPIIAMLAEESRIRQTEWLKEGCNSFNKKRQTSNPMSFWTEQDVLQYIKQNKIPIASVYGDIVCENDGLLYTSSLIDNGCKYCTTGCSRTGCIFCLFGAHGREDDRLVQLKQTHPRQYEYCMNGGAYDTDGFWKPTKEGLGIKHCIDELNKIYGKDFIKY